MKKEKLIFIVGPTAVGKTEVAYYLARKLKGEIISCDSMQIYTGMRIIASQPLPRLSKVVPHYLVAKISPLKEYDVASFRKAALRAIETIVRKNHVPILVGGTGLYVNALVDGLFEGVTQDEQIRKRLYNKAKELGSAYLHKKLQVIDPQAALKIHPNDTKRIIRALEVFEITKKPISQLQKQRKGLWDKFDIHIFCLDMERDQLYQRIGARVEAMCAQGLVKEAKKLLSKKLSKTAACAIGLRELKDYFAGILSLEEAKELIKKNTRNYAKRQLTWFRKDKRISWININPPETPRQIGSYLWKKLS